MKILDWEVAHPQGERGVFTKWYQSLNKIEFVLSVLGTVEAMSPRVHVEPPLENRVVGREMRELRARLEAMEAMQKRTPTAEDASDA